MRFSLMPRVMVQWLLPILVALVSFRFVAGVEMTMPHMLSHFQQRPLAFYGHLIFAPIALAVLPFQFWKKLRLEKSSLHRRLGQVYGVSILISGVAAMSLAGTTPAGPIAGAGFGLLGVIWLFTTVYAIYLAMQKNIADHQKWIIRSAALTFAAVTLRIYLPFLVMGFGFETGYLIVAWLCWVPNLILAEYLIRSRLYQRI